MTVHCPTGVTREDESVGSSCQTRRHHSHVTSQYYSNLNVVTCCADPPPQCCCCCRPLVPFDQAYYFSNLRQLSPPRLISLPPPPTVTIRQTKSPSTSESKNHWRGIPTLVESSKSSTQPNPTNILLTANTLPLTVLSNPNPTSVKQNSGNKPMRLRGRAKSMRLGSFVQVPDGNMSLSDEMAWLRRHRNSQGRLSLQEKRENMKTEGVAIFTLPLSPSGSVDSSSRILHLLPHELSYRNVEAVEEVFFGIDPDNADQYNQDGTIRDTIDANRIVAEDYDPMELGPGLISICPISSKYPREAQWNHANQNGEDGNESPKLARLPKVVLELQRRLVQSIEASMKLDLMGPPCQEFFIM
eukprot:GHVH01007356.1.p1 GENE.GHVH01007356.1~~GHVH01007356.1.p1  ORF type:complete len:357 (+),score=35.09 GHVH01007356.1:916-1986(+)